VPLTYHRRSLMRSKNKPAFSFRTGACHCSLEQEHALPSAYGHASGSVRANDTIERHQQDLVLSHHLSPARPLSEPLRVATGNDLVSADVRRCGTNIWLSETPSVHGMAGGGLLETR
jgi:hypothetical protein